MLTTEVTRLAFKYGNLCSAVLLSGSLLEMHGNEIVFVIWQNHTS